MDARIQQPYQESGMQTEFGKSAQEISAHFRKLEAEYHGVALGGFRLLEAFDPETAWLALEACDDRSVAAMWLAERAGALSGERPWDCLARGNARQVRQVLKAISHGVPPP